MTTSGIKSIDTSKSLNINTQTSTPYWYCDIPNSYVGMGKISILFRVTPTVWSAKCLENIIWLKTDDSHFTETCIVASLLWELIVVYKLEPLNFLMALNWTYNSSKPLVSPRIRINVEFAIRARLKLNRNSCAESWFSSI